MESGGGEAGWQGRGMSEERSYHNADGNIPRLLVYTGLENDAPCTTRLRPFELDSPGVLHQEDFLLCRKESFLSLAMSRARRHESWSRLRAAQPEGMFFCVTG